MAAVNPPAHVAAYAWATGYKVLRGAQPDSWVAQGTAMSQRSNLPAGLQRCSTGRPSESTSGSAVGDRTEREIGT